MKKRYGHTTCTEANRSGDIRRWAVIYRQYPGDKDLTVDSLSTKREAAALCRELNDDGFCARVFRIRFEGPIE